MSYDLYLSYSGRYSYLKCPKKYWYNYIKKQPRKEDKKHTLFGSTIGKVFEYFYNKNFWMGPNPEQKTIASIESAIDAVCYHEKIDKDTYSDIFSEIRVEIESLVPEIINNIKKHKLLMPSSKSEVDLTVKCRNDDFNLTIKVGGRADFIHSNGNNVWIIDGKGSKYREKYVDSEQLIWYAVQHYLKYHVSPTRLGFFYYKFPKDPIQWVEYNEQSVRSNLKLTFEISKKILNNEFIPNPTGECHRCDFHGICEEGISYLASRRVKTGGRIDTDNDIFDLEFV